MTHILSAGLVGTALLAMTTLAGAAAPDAADPLAAYRGKARVLVVVASAASDTRLARQRAIFAAMRAGAEERDLVLVEAVGTKPAAEALRRAFDLPGGFHSVLVGKDGGGKLTAAEPLGPDRLFPLIDAMPMRQEEMRRR